MSELSKREREIIAAIVEGGFAKSIARSLGLSVRTVKNHLLNIRRKLKARTTPQAAAIWARNMALKGANDRRAA